MTAAKEVMAAQQGWVCRCFKKWIVITAQAARRMCVFRTYFVSALCIAPRHISISANPFRRGGKQQYQSF